MERLICLFSMVLVFGLVSCGGAEKTSLDGYGLKGKVKSVKSNTYDVEINFGEISKGGASSGENSLLKFDEQGDATEMVTYSVTGEILCRYIDKFNDEHHLVERLEYDGEGKLTKWVYELEKDKFKSATLYNDAGEVVGRIAYEYDGDWKKQIWYDAEGEEINLFSGLYKDEKLVQYTYKYKDVPSEIQAFLSYDKSGNVVEFKQIMGGEVTLLTYSYKFDGKGNWIERLEFKGEDKYPNRIAAREIEYYEQ